MKIGTGFERATRSAPEMLGTIDENHRPTLRWKRLPTASG
jgi:hypothetical protein